MKRTAIITGSSRGIGYEIARQLGLDGMNVVMVARHAPQDDRLEALKREGIEYIFVEAGIDTPDDRRRIVEEALKHFGRIDVLVNNAGVAPEVRRDLLEMTEESFDRVIGINTKGTMFLTQMVARQMIEQPWDGCGKRGDIVNISSCSAEVSSVARGEYCISKAGVSMLTKLYADRLAGEGIHVNEVRPGVIATEMTAVVKEKYDKLISEGLFPIARWGTPKDVAGVVSALVSERFAYTTGNYIDVDGGFHIRRL